MADEVKYVRLGISPRNDEILEQLAAKAFKNALTKADVGKLFLQYAIDHYGDVLDWYKGRGLDVIEPLRETD